MSKLFLSATTLIFISLFAFYACDKKIAKQVKATAPVAGFCDSIKFTKYIKPIIIMECTQSCHGATNPSGGVSLVTYDDIKAKATNIKNRINSASSPMPQAGKMPQTRIDSIECWINNGALNN